MPIAFTDDSSSPRATTVVSTDIGMSPGGPPCPKAGGTMARGNIRSSLCNRIVMTVVVDVPDSARYYALSAVRREIGPEGT